MKARMNAAGNAMYHELKDELDLDIRWSGSYVAALDDEQMDVLKELLERGNANGVPGLKIVSGDEMRKEEPNVSKDIKGHSGLRLPASAGLSAWPWLLRKMPSSTALKSSVNVRLRVLP